MYRKLRNVYLASTLIKGRTIKYLFCYVAAGGHENKDNQSSGIFECLYSIPASISAFSSTKQAEIFSKWWGHLN